MGIDPRCDVDVGKHLRPYWKDKNGSLIVCSLHKAQYDDRVAEFGAIDWEEVMIHNIFNED